MSRYNSASSFLDELQDKPLSNQQINDYFSILRHCVLKCSHPQCNIILNLYESLAKGERISLYDNKFKDFGLHSVAIALERELSKNGLTDIALALANEGIDRDFNDISSILKKDKELCSNQTTKQFMLELTPIIKSKVKTAMKKSADASKYIANPAKKIKGE